MRHARRLSVLVLLAAVSHGGAQERSFGRATSLELPRGKRAEDVLLADLDGDGGRDLLVAAARGGERSGRTLRVHLRRNGEAAFGPQPDLELALLPDVVGFAVADVHADPGAEIVLFAPTGVFALRWRAEDERDRYAKLFDADVLWQLPHHRATHVLQDTLADMDGDGRVDLLVPEPGGYRVALQRESDGARVFETSELHLPDGGAAAPTGRGGRRQKGRQRRRELRIAVSVGGDGGASPDLLAVHESVPAPTRADWDGDGRLDVLAQTTDDLLVWTAAAGFPRAPDVVVPLPLEVDRRRLLDVSFAALSADMDGDRRADYVLVAGDQDSDEPRAQVALYTQAAAAKADGPPLFGERGRPSQLLVVAGIAGSPELVDVDGDGSPDLTLGAVRLDALDALRAATGSTIDAEVYVYLNRGGKLSRTPDLTAGISVAAKGLRADRRDSIVELIGDVTGDGVSELLLREDPTHLRLQMVRRTKEGLTLVDRPLWETVVDEDAEIVRTPPGDGPAEIVALTPRRLLHVRFGR